MSVLQLGTLEKAQKVLALYTNSSESLSFSEIVDRTGLEKGSVQRLLFTLQNLGLLRKHQRYKRYSLSPRFISYAVSFCQSDPLLQLAPARLETLARLTTEAVSVCLMDGIHVFYLTRIANLAHRIFALQPTRHFAYCTAGGRAILSCLKDEEVERILTASQMRRLTSETIIDPDAILKLIGLFRREGLAWQDGEVHLDELGLAAPIIGERDLPVGAVVMSIRKEKFTLDEARRQFAALIQTAARDLSSQALSASQIGAT
ncbi:MAG: IclR family transcriptional regulator [Geminicoccaceae bacterium]